MKTTRKVQRGWRYLKRHRDIDILCHAEAMFVALIIDTKTYIMKLYVT
jgi:hypothetical protein